MRIIRRNLCEHFLERWPRGFIAVHAESDRAVPGVIFQAIDQKFEDARIAYSKSGEKKRYFPALLLAELFVQLEQERDGVLFDGMQAHHKVVGDIVRASA